MNNTTALNPFLEHCQKRIHAYLKKQMPSPSQPPQRLHRAMHYAVLGAGKRLRPLLVYATGAAFETPLEKLDAPAAAVELIHCYSLIHDDLPAMDDDDLRRGQLTCHKAFNEATAILVGDALQSLAFECLTEIEMVSVLAHASGSQGMAGGQDLDLAAEGKPLDLMQLEQIHRLKTGAIIQASVQLGAIASNCQNAGTFSLLKLFSQNIGLAFQIHDDILDVEGDTETIGKTAGADVAAEKATYPAILGLIESKKRRQKAFETAMNALHQLSLNTEHLETLCHHIVRRSF